MEKSFQFVNPAEVTMAVDIKEYYEKISLKILKEIIKSTSAALRIQQEVYTWRTKNQERV